MIHNDDYSEVEDLLLYKPEHVDFLLKCFVNFINFSQLYTLSQIYQQLYEMYYKKDIQFPIKKSTTDVNSFLTILIYFEIIKYNPKTNKYYIIDFVIYDINSKKLLLLLYNNLTIINYIRLLKIKTIIN